MQYMTMCAPELIDDRKVVLQDEEEVRNFMYNYPSDLEVQGYLSAKLQRIVTLETLCDIIGESRYNEERLTAAYIEPVGDIYGTDELVALVAIFDYQGEEWFMTFDVARYGDIWHNMSLQGMAGYMLGLHIYNGGVAGPISDF